MDAVDLEYTNPNNGIQTIGQATPTFYLGNPNQLISVHIDISTNTTVNWCTSDMAGCPSSTQIMMDHTIAHELGHGMGLQHPVNGPNQYAVLECVQSTGEGTSVQADDTNGQMYLYSGHPTDFGSPGSIPC